MGPIFLRDISNANVWVIQRKIALKSAISFGREYNGPLLFQKAGVLLFS